MSDTTLQTISRKQAPSARGMAMSGNISATEYLNLIQRDGILRTRNLSKVENAVTLRRNRKLVTENESSNKERNQKKFDYSQLQLTFSEANIWLLPVNSKKIAVQWHLPMGMRRNCLDIFKGEEACFVLRIYQNLETPSGWKKSQRTLEFEIDINRNCCYINLENSKGLYTAELGLRCSRDRHIFIARSTEIRMPISGVGTLKKVEHTMPISKQSWNKNHPLKHKVTPKAITPEDERGWDGRDVMAEENTIAIYQDFIAEGPRSLRIADKINQSDEVTRKNNLAKRKVKTCTPKQKATSKDHNQWVNALCINPQNKISSINEFQVVTVPSAAKKNENIGKGGINPQIQKKIDAVASREKPAIVNCNSLRDKISKLKENAEIILRGKVKRAGQRVRVGGLLIEPEDDGSFCVACVIRNGKLYVPVEEVNAICEL